MLKLEYMMTYSSHSELSPHFTSPVTYSLKALTRPESWASYKVVSIRTSGTFRGRKWSLPKTGDGIPALSGRETRRATTRVATRDDIVEDLRMLVL
jgi:hypothetical protein